MNNRQFFWVLLIPVLIPLLLTPAQAQSTAATVLGTVTDTGGAVVPGVTVTLTNQGHGVHPRDHQRRSRGLPVLGRAGAEHVHPQRGTARFQENTSISTTTWPLGSPSGSTSNCKWVKWRSR